MKAWLGILIIEKITEKKTEKNMSGIFFDMMSSKKGVVQGFLNSYFQQFF